MNTAPGWPAPTPRRIYRKVVPLPGKAFGAHLCVIGKVIEALFWLDSQILILQLSLHSYCGAR